MGEVGDIIDINFGEVDGGVDVGKPVFVSKQK